MHSCIAIWETPLLLFCVVCVCVCVIIYGELIVDAPSTFMVGAYNTDVLGMLSDPVLAFKSFPKH